MMKHLVFQLYGPLASWGEIAVGERRESSVRPSKSAIMGMLGAALGLRRAAEEEHRRLSDAYGFAVRTDAPGEFLRDYHTTQAPTSKGGRTYYTRRDEIGASDLHTILSQRDYRMDARHTVALWGRGNDLPYSLDGLRTALHQPRLVLYMGRKSCPLALPVRAQVVQSETLYKAFTDAEVPDEILDGLPVHDTEEYAWEAHPAPGLEASMVYPRRDEVRSRRRWQFSERDEYYAALPRERDW